MKKTLALIAHDGKKADMVAFVKDHIEYLRQANIIATGTTGSSSYNVSLTQILNMVFYKGHIEYLRQANIIATGTTGSYIRQTGLEVELKLSGPMGGDAQIAALTAEGKVDGIIFFRDPLGKHVHEPDILMLMRISDLYNVPIATNPATGSLIIEGLL